PARDLEEPLRRRRQHVELRQAEIRRERRGTQPPKLQVRGPRRPRDIGVEAAREIHLIAVAGADMRLDPLERRAVTLGVEARADARGHGETADGALRRLRRRKPLDEAIPFVERPLVASGADEPRAPLGVVDDHRPVVEAYRGVRNADVVPSDHRQAFEAASEIVREIADRAAGERQMPGQIDGARRRRTEQPPEQLERIVARAFYAAARPDLGLVAARRERRVRLGREDIEPPYLAAEPAAVEEDVPRAVEQRGEAARGILVVFDLGDAWQDGLQARPAAASGRAVRALVPDANRC